MKIIGINIFRNEADIIESFVRYHLQIFDRIIAINHRSVDSSTRIIENLQKEGLPVELHEEKRVDFQQSDTMSRIMKKAVFDYSADWVIPLDTDEFLTVPRVGKVHEVLEGIPRDKIIKLSYRTYVPLPSNDNQEPNVLKRITNCRSSEKQYLFKILIPRAMAVKRGAIIASGNHGLVKKIFSRQKEFPNIISDRLVLAHFPVRSINQIMTKAFVVWLSTLAKPNKEPTEAFHLKLLFDRFLKNSITPEELTTIALSYVSNQHVPFNPDIIFNKPLCPEKEGFDLRYTALLQENPLLILARTAEELAEALADAKRRGLSVKFNRNYLVSKLLFWRRKLKRGKYLNTV